MAKQPNTIFNSRRTAAVRRTDFPRPETYANITHWQLCVCVEGIIGNTRKHHPRLPTATVRRYLGPFGILFDRRYLVIVRYITRVLSSTRPVNRTRFTVKPTNLFAMDAAGIWRAGDN